MNLMMEESELEERFVEIQPLLHAIAKDFFPCYADRQDAVQECMIKAWQARKQLKFPEAFRCWAVQIMRNKCIDAQRRRIDAAPLNEETLSLSDDPIIRFIDCDALHDALKLLPPLRRDMVSRYYLRGYSFEELANEYHLCIGTVKSRLYRALKQLALILSV